MSHSQKFLGLIQFTKLCIVPNYMSGKPAHRSDGGIGRRSGLKIHRPYGCASSTLAPSTTISRGYTFDGVAFLFDLTLVLEGSSLIKLFDITREEKLTVICLCCIQVQVFAGESLFRTGKKGARGNQLQ